MIQRWIPEELLWEALVRTRFGGGGGAGRPPPAHSPGPPPWSGDPTPLPPGLVERLPFGLPLSATFWERFRRFAPPVLCREIVIRIGTRGVRLSVDGQTRVVTVGDPGFWAGQEFVLTAEGVAKLWDWYLGKRVAVACRWRVQSPWDAVLTGMFRPESDLALDPEWFLARGLPWLPALVIMLRRGRWQEPDPWWLGYCREPATVPYPLRFFLVEAAGAWRQAMAAFFSRQGELLAAGGAEPRCDRALAHRVRAGDDLVGRAFRTWCETATAGFDDARHLEGCAAAAGLFPSIRERAPTLEILERV